MQPSGVSFLRTYKTPKFCFDDKSPLTQAVSELQKERGFFTPYFGVAPGVDAIPRASAISQFQHLHPRMHETNGTSMAFAQAGTGQQPCVEELVGGSLAPACRMFCSPQRPSWEAAETHSRPSVDGR